MNEKRCKKGELKKRISTIKKKHMLRLKLYAAIYSAQAEINADPESKTRRAM